MNMRAAAALAACFTLGAGLASAVDPAPRRIRFDKGKSAATIPRTLEVQGDDAETHQYQLLVASGQILTVGFEAADPVGAYSVERFAARSAASDSGV